MLRYSHARYATLCEVTFTEMRKLGELKGGEYAGDDDRLANFRRNGQNLGLPMETVWAVYAGKHWDAIQQFIKDNRQGISRDRLESIVGRVDDLMVYCLLLKAMLDEKGHDVGIGPDTAWYTDKWAEKTDGSPGLSFGGPVTATEIRESTKALLDGSSRLGSDGPNKQEFHKGDPTVKSIVMDDLRGYTTKGSDE